MEWVEVTAKSVESAKELALDRLGISADDAEFEVLEEPRSGLFGRVRGEARVRARVRPATVRPKQERRGRRRTGASTGSADSSRAATAAPPPEDASELSDDAASTGAAGTSRRRRRQRGRSTSTDRPDLVASSDVDEGATMSEYDDEIDRDLAQSATATVPVAEVSAAAEQFTSGLVAAFGLDGTTSAVVDGNEIEVRVDATGSGQGAGLGLLIGPSGRTLLAIQDLARVAAQRRLGDHETRLRVDVAGYREKRRHALERFAREVAAMVVESGVARSLEPMPSSDRKVVHDTLTTIDGVVSRSEGEEPMRRIIVSPA
jgi:spoIIIJ-associated protein